MDLIFSNLKIISQNIHYRYVWKGIGAPEFDIARNTLNLIYNQTLFWVGFYYSPLLSAVIAIKLFITFYIKQASFSGIGKEWFTLIFILTGLCFAQLYTAIEILASCSDTNCLPGPHLPCNHRGSVHSRLHNDSVRIIQLI